MSPHRFEFHYNSSNYIHSNRGTLNPLISLFLAKYPLIFDSQFNVSHLLSSVNRPLLSITLLFRSVFFFFSPPFAFSDVDWTQTLISSRRVLFIWSQREKRSNAMTIKQGCMFARQRARKKSSAAENVPPLQQCKKIKTFQLLRYLFALRLILLFFFFFFFHQPVWVK